MFDFFFSTYIVGLTVLGRSIHIHSSHFEEESLLQDYNLLPVTNCFLAWNPIFSRGQRLSVARRRKVEGAAGASSTSWTSGPAGVEAHATLEPHQAPGALLSFSSGPFL